MAPLFQAIANIFWPSHLFQPENAIRFKGFGADTSGGVAWFEHLLYTFIVPDRHKAVIRYVGLKANINYAWILKINGQADPEYGNVNYINTDPTIDGWLIRQDNARIVLKAQAKVTLHLSSLPLQDYVFLLRGYYWPE